MGVPRVLGLGILGLAVPVVFAAGPDSQEFSLNLGATTASRLMNDSTFVDHQSNSSTQVSFIERRPLYGPIYWNAGFFGELYTFSNAHDFPVHQLQGYAAQFSVEYFQNADLAAYLKIRPGFYFENRPVLSAWDVPVEAVTGVPLRRGLHGVVGFSNGRFYHHALPIVGLSWDLNERMTLNAVYPEPSWTYKLNEKFNCELAGELLGDGFKTDSSPYTTRVEYYEYRIGGWVRYRVQPHWNVVGGAGYELMRVFDFYQQNTKLEAQGAPFLQVGLEYSN